MSIQLLAICTGSVAPLLIRDEHDKRHLTSEMSGIQKSAVSTMATPTPITCKRLGLEGDEQADLSVHGGLNKAVYCYPLEHYAFWKEALPWLAERDVLYGQVGENLCMQGLFEHEIWIGDRIKIGEEVLLMVTKPREPCYKFNARMKSNQAVKLMKHNNVSGWYCSVLQEGRIKPGDAVEVIAGGRDTTVLEENQRLGKRKA
jgi:MOSC domain-containing protein YiiM